MNPHASPALLELPPTDRPRERFLREGPHAVEPEELLAIVLGTGRGGHEDALQLARRVIDELDGLEGLASAPVERLLAISGIGPVKAARVRAAFEMALRAGPIEPPPPDAFELAVGRLRGQVPTGQQAVLAWRPEGDSAPLTLSLGDALGARSRAGSAMSRLLSTPGEGPWWIASVRPGGRPRKAELDAAARLTQAAALLEIPLRRVLLLTPNEAWDLAEIPR